MLKTWNGGSRRGSRRPASPNTNGFVEPPTKVRRTGLAPSDLIPGIIQKIHLENFMCHSNLDFFPNENLNFVTGKAPSSLLWLYKKNPFYFLGIFFRSEWFRQKQHSTGVGVGTFSRQQTY